MKETKWKNRINLIIMIAIFAGAIISALANPADRVAISFEENDLVIEGADEVVYKIPLDTIQEVTYVEDAEYAADVQEQQDVICGQYKNDRWGDHFLCVYAQLPACIVVDSQEGTYVFNYQNADTTKKFYDAFLEMLQERGNT